MNLIDTHSHLFLEEFSEDLPLVIERAQNAGVRFVFMPNIDSSTIESMLKVCDKYPDFCFPMIGLHPTSVNADYKKELDVVLAELSANRKRYIAIGEIGMDLYWDKTFLKEQQIAFATQLDFALEFDLPVVIHCRNAFEHIFNILDEYKHTTLRGVFHSFMGTEADVEYILDNTNFYFGVNGVVTFKNSSLPAVLPLIPLNKIVLETDAPYLAPVPHRGRRNESAYIKDTLIKVSEIYQLPVDDVAQITSETALELFAMSDSRAKDFKVY